MPEFPSILELNLEHGRSYRYSFRVTCPCGHSQKTAGARGYATPMGTRRLHVFLLKKCDSCGLILSFKAMHTLDEAKEEVVNRPLSGGRFGSLPTRGGEGNACKRSGLKLFVALFAHLKMKSSSPGQLLNGDQSAPGHSENNWL